MKNYTGKSIEEILEKAAYEKNCPVEELKYFLTDEKKGLLGLGSSVSADVYCMDDVKEFLLSETFEIPVDFTNIKGKLFVQEGKIESEELAMCSTIIKLAEKELQKNERGN